MAGRQRFATTVRTMPRRRSAQPKPVVRETSLYAPVKRFLETLGFDVKGEICGCDLVALRGDEPPLVVIGELKLGFNLELILQAVNRTAACDQIWLAVRVSGRGGRERDPRVRKLCRFLGFGLLGVSATGRVEVIVEPAPWRPRRDARRRSRLVNEHRRRIGDPALGGMSKAPIMTAYRQQALACAASLADGPRRTKQIKTAVPDAAKILLRNVYGWFVRVERGVYALTPEGMAALLRWPQATAGRHDPPSTSSRSISSSSHFSSAAANSACAAASATDASSNVLRSRP
jgi:hypothetical protein